MSELQTVRKIADVTRDIRIKTGQFLMDAIDIGRLLYEAKAMVEPGKWSQYIAEELPFSHSWANNYMRLYKELGDNQVSLFGDSQALGNLRPTQALELLALPAEERQEFVETHDVEHMSTRDLHQAIRERDEARKAKEEAEARAREAVEKLETAQKAQKIADPDLTAVQLLGQQILNTWNTMQGHRKKAEAKNPDNAAPLAAFLRQLIKTMEGSINGTAG